MWQISASRALFFKYSGQKGEKKDKGQGGILDQRQTVLYLGQTAYGLLRGIAVVGGHYCSRRGRGHLK